MLVIHKNFMLNMQHNIIEFLNVKLDNRLIFVAMETYYLFSDSSDIGSMTVGQMCVRVYLK